MAIQIRYFASLRERLGRSHDELSLQEPALTVAQLWSTLWPDTPLPPNTLIAINQEYADTQAVPEDGDEVAFFPPVTGG